MDGAGLFRNRKEAAKRLASLLLKYKDGAALVLAIPRGGVPIGRVIAQQLNIPLDIALSKKIGHPFHKEFAVGAVSLDDVIVNPDINLSAEYLEAEIKSIRDFLKERYLQLKGTTEPLPITNKTVIITDDGIATGNTMLATIRMTKRHLPSAVVVASPVISPNAYELLKSEADEVVSLAIPPLFIGVSQFYRDFSEVSDEEVKELLQESSRITN